MRGRINKYSYSLNPAKFIDPQGLLPDAPVPVSATANKGTIRIITYNNGDTEIRTGGSRAWRNNNPGNISATGDFANNHRAIGDDGTFAIFPDKKTGDAALAALLCTNKYQSKTISKAIETYTPSTENDTERYKSMIEKETGLKADTNMKDLTTDQLNSVVQAIGKQEGWIEGTVTTKKAQ